MAAMEPPQKKVALPQPVAARFSFGQFLSWGLLSRPDFCVSNIWRFNDRMGDGTEISWRYIDGYSWNIFGM